MRILLCFIILLMAGCDRPRYQFAKISESCLFMLNSANGDLYTWCIFQAAKNERRWTKVAHGPETGYLDPVFNKPINADKSP